MLVWFQRSLNDHVDYHTDALPLVCEDCRMYTVIEETGNEVDGDILSYLCGCGRGTYVCVKF